MRRGNAIDARIYPYAGADLGRMLQLIVVLLKLS